MYYYFVAELIYKYLCNCSLQRKLLIFNMIFAIILSIISYQFTNVVATYAIPYLDFIYKFALQKLGTGWTIDFTYRISYHH